MLLYETNSRNETLTVSDRFLARSELDGRNLRSYVHFGNVDFQERFFMIHGKGYWCFILQKLASG